MKILIINGPNLNLIGTRETSIYGNQSFDDYFLTLKSKSELELHYLQSNVEGELINFLQQARADGVILNAGAYTHTSIAIRDCIAAIGIPVVEVHISDISSRESFRHNSLLTPVCVGCVFGFGLKGYEMALSYFR
jgi:3-dehydroquinate dehydratase-2